MLMRHDKRPSAVAACMAAPPIDCNQVVVVHASPNGWVCSWANMGADDAALALYCVADEILRQKVPLASMNIH